jgi:hypothetical protein
LFFVFFKVGLKYIVHNKPGGLSPSHIFDDVQTGADGRQIRGSGKLRMYLVDANVVLQQLEFEKSPPFTDLIRELFCLFQSLAVVGVCRNLDREPWSKDTSNVKKLKDCKAIIRLMNAAMKRTDWPDVCDKVEAGSRSRSEGVEGQGWTRGSGGGCSALPCSFAHPHQHAHRVSKRGREEDEDGDTAPTKCSKVKTE